MATVTTPNPTFSGTRGGLHFVDGRAVADRPLTARQRRFFDRAGYTVDESSEPVDAPSDDDSDTVADSSRPAVRASRPEWDAYAASLGIGTEGLSKDQVIQAVNDHEAEPSGVSDA